MRCGQFLRASYLFRAQGVDGELTKIKGTAVAKNLMKPGQLTVHFQGTPALFSAPYWIVALGDEDGVSVRRWQCFVQGHRW